jgi:hypothetical protein
MTNLEFDRLHKQARVKVAVTQYKALTELKGAYIAVADSAARAVIDAKLRGLSSLTLGYWLGIKTQMSTALETFGNDTTEIATTGVRSNVDTMTGISKAYLTANAVNEYVTREGLAQMYSRVNDDVVKSVFNRVWQDGYTFSQRVWRNGESVQDDIKRILENGIIAGRDPAKIAKDIQAFTVDGQVGLAKRWANVERGTSAWVSRMPKSIDWRGIRLVRSELQIAVQDAGRQSGLTNPASTGTWRWVMGPGLDHCEVCEGYSKQIFTEETLPTYPHGNCVEAGTLIMTPDGLRKIEELKPGDLIISHNGEVNAINRTWKNHYEGEMIDIATETGKKVTVTMDHPIVKGSKFVPAKSLNLGDDILCVSGNVPLDTAVENKAHHSPSIGLKKSGFFNVKLMFSPGGMPVATVNFNGKLYVFKRKINVVFPIRKVWERFISGKFESIVHKLFVNGQDLSLSRNSTPNKNIVGTLNTPIGIMARLSNGNPSLRIRPGVSIGYGWKCISVHDEVSVNSSTSNAEPFGYLVNREILVSKQFVNDALWNVVNCTHNERIVQLHRKKVNAVVYNLSIGSTQTYVSNGIVSHNCGCQPVPILMPRDDFVSDLSAWAKGDVSEKNRYLDVWYGSVYKRGM